jgi:hypothetical protein
MAGAQPIKPQDIEPLTETKAWKALELRYKKDRRSISENSLRRIRSRANC